MSQIMINSVVKDAVVVAAKLALPILVTMLVVGLFISIIQATTQINEQTLTFLPKLLISAVVGIFLGSWMLKTLIAFTNRVFDLILQITT